mgnify:CR=1 FL=1
MANYIKRRKRGNRFFPKGFSASNWSNDGNGEVGEEWSKTERKLGRTVKKT